MDTHTSEGKSMMTTPRMRVICSAVVLVLAFACSASFAQEQSFDVKAHYDKSEVMIPMRDGIKLFTIIYSPKDKSSNHPIIITRTAYGIGPYGPDNYRPVIGPNNDFAREGYIVVYQDSRGKFKSEGEFIHHVPYKAKKGPKEFDESSDTYDTIDWLVKHVPNNNGRVGQWGNSWGGWQVSLGMIDAHPALKASSPQSPSTGSVPGGRPSFQRRVPAHVLFQLDDAERPGKGGRTDRTGTAAISLSYAGWLQIFPGVGGNVECRPRLFQGAIPHLE